MVVASTLSAARYGAQEESFGEALLLCMVGTAEDVGSADEISDEVNSAATAAEAGVDVARPAGVALATVGSNVIEGSVSTTDGVASPPSLGADVADGSGAVTLIYLQPHRHHRLSHRIGALSLRRIIMA